MTRLATFAAALLAALVTPDLAAAGPVAAAIAAINAFAASSALAAFVVRLGVSLALSALASALQKKPDQPRRPGIKTDTTTTGGSNPQTFILGTYATAGNMVAPPYSHPNSGDVPNRWLTYVVDVSDMPGVQFSRLIVAGKYVTDLQAHSGTHQQEGMFGEGGNPNLFLTWHDGTQTAADAYMMANYASHPERPWSADMVGTGVAYAVVTFKYNRKLFNSLPGVRFEVKGLPLYDPRLDSTVGGAGAQRWADPATWAFTDNPMVMIYNILRGITLPDGSRWGGQVPAEDLPLDAWFAAMNECDVAVPLNGGGTQKQYRAGLEVSVDQTPAGVIDELLKACSGEITEMGGVYKPRVGPPGLPVYFITDDDIVADQSQSLAPYPGLDGVHNAIHATYPHPESLWETRDAPPRYNAAWEAEDGGRQLVAQVDLPAVPYGLQVQRLMKAWIEDERRFRRHGLTLPPDAAVLEPLDTLAWTSAREGYTSKVFEVGEVTDDLATCLQTISMREREAGDFAWTPAADEIDLEHPSAAPVLPAERVLAGVALVSQSLLDGAANARRPGLALSWDTTDLLPDDAVEYRLQLSDGTPVAAGVAPAAEGQVILSGGVLPATAYRAQARLLTRLGGTWSAWASATTDDVRMAAADLAPDAIEWGTLAQSVRDQIDSAGDAKLSADAAAAAEAAADGHRAAAAVHEANAALAQSNAEDAAAGAVFARDVAARVLGGGAVENPIFVEPAASPAALPDGFTITAAAGGTVSRLATGGKYGACLEYDTGATLSASEPSVAHDLTASGGLAAADVEAVQLDLEVELLTGAGWGSAHVAVEWQGASTGVVRVYLAAALVASAGAVQRLTALVERPAGYAQGGADLVRVVYFGNEDGNTAQGEVQHTARLHRFDYQVVGLAASALVSQKAIAELSGNAAAAVVLRAKAGTGGAELELSALSDVEGATASQARISADDIMLEGSVRATYMTVDEYLDIDALDAGFRMGKTSAADGANDGIYMGRHDDGAGGTSFGFYAGRQAGGDEQSILMTKEDGLVIRNAKYMIGGGTLSETSYTASQTVSLAGKTTMTLQMVGGGGGGAGGEKEGGTNTATNGQAGGNTVVKLKDGTTTIATWTATGGAGGVGFGAKAGQKSTLTTKGDGGNGGAGGSWKSGTQDSPGYWIYTTGKAADGKGGSKGQFKQVIDYDISGLSDPKLEITIGQGGAGGSGDTSGSSFSGPDAYNNNGGNGAAGSGGQVIVQTSAVVPVEAGAVAIKPVVGNFTTTTGAGSFPSISPGRGLWLLSTSPSTWKVTFSSNGGHWNLGTGNVRAIVADMTPTWSEASSATTVYYRFYPM